MYLCSGWDVVGSESSVGGGRSSVRTYVCPFIFSLESTDDICYIVLIYAMVDLLINFSTVNFVCFIN